MSPETIGVLGLAVLMVLLFGRMWIGLAMIFVALAGIGYLRGFTQAFTIARTIPYTSTAFYPVTAVPMFILMGIVIAKGKMGEDLYDAAYKWIGWMRGGLAMATVLACALFASITGSSQAGTVTMGKVALPEMRKHHYDDHLATGCIACAGTLGILIPPSLGFIMYGILTEQSIGTLFMAGIGPGILLTLLMVGAIWMVTRFRPLAGPSGPKTSFREKVLSLRKIWHVLALFLLVLGGIYGGLFTPTEAGAVGAFGACVITALTGQLSVRSFLEALMETATLTAMSMLLIIGAFILMKFLALSRLPFALSAAIIDLNLSPWAVFGAIVALYLILGMFLDIISGIVLTLPIIYPLVQAQGFDPIWFGVNLVILMEMGLVTPPVGMNVFVLAGVTGTPLDSIFRGVTPFVIAMLICIGLVAAFPQIALFLPRLVS